MTRLLAAACAILIALALWLTPFSLSTRGAVGLCSDEGAYRMRMCELALWSGETVQHDRLLEPRAGQDIPYGLFAPAISAFVLARTLPRGTLDIEHGQLDEDVLVDGAARLGLIMGWAAVLALAFVGRKFSASHAAAASKSYAAIATTMFAAVAWTALALAPSMDGGSVRAPVWGLILGALNLWGAAKLARPRDLMDQLGIAIAVGVITGVALLNEPFAWPGLLAPLIALWFGVRGAEKKGRRDALRCGIFFVASALAVFGLRSSWPAGATPLPQFDPAWQLASGVVAEPCIFGAGLLLAAWLVLSAHASAERRALCVVLLASLVLRGMDPRFAAAPLAPAGCAFVCFATSMVSEASNRRLWRATPIGIAMLLLFAAFSSDSAHFSEPAIAALRELRESTPSSGAWNHPAAAQSYAILANPRAAGSILFHARRAVCGALLPGQDCSPAARAAADALSCDSTAELLTRAEELHAA